MTDVMTTKKPKKQKAAYLFPVELIAERQRRMTGFDDHVISM